MIGEKGAAGSRLGFRRTINRDHSPLFAQGLPLLTVLLGSLTPFLPVITAGPVMPPIGFMIFIAWRLVRPGLFPLWIGFPLGAFDDLFSGQPFGSAILLWSLTMLALETLEARFPWRGFWQDWITASALLAAYLVISAVVAGPGFELWHVKLILPQLLLSILLFPIIARMVAMFDRVRLYRVRVID